MPSKKRSRVAQLPAKPSSIPAPAPRNSRDVLSLLKSEAHAAPAQKRMVAHLEEVEALFPGELFGAFRAFLEQRTSGN